MDAKLSAMLHLVVQFTEPDFQLSKEFQRMKNGHNLSTFSISKSRQLYCFLNSVREVEV